MPILAFLKNLKVIAIGLAVIIIFFAGYHLRTLRYEAALADHNATIIKSIPEVITKTQVLTRIIRDAKDSCVNAPIPADVLNELR